MSEEKDFCFLYGLGDEDYHDMDGNSISLHKLSRLKPEWAAARIREGRKLADENTRLRGLMINLVSSAKARPHPASEYGEVIVCGDDFNAIENEVSDE
tara:strand:+ start:5898 stop:6191 length:294 start_codon:yes stop_codon:yes gene_type:complete